MSKAKKKSTRKHNPPVVVREEQQVTLTDGQVEAVVQKVTEKLMPLISSRGTNEPGVVQTTSGSQEVTTGTSEVIQLSPLPGEIQQTYSDQKTPEGRQPQTVLQQHDFKSKNTDLGSLGQTPINVEFLLKCLEHYPNKVDAKLIADGFTNGFRIHFNGPRHSRDCDNLVSVKQNPESTFQKVMKEIQLGRVAGPFEKPPFENFIVSPIGLIPKKDGTFRLIQHLSYPPGHSINDNIDPNECSVHYASIDDVVDSIMRLGPQCMLGKMDVKSAFRLLPIHRDDFCLLGFRFQGLYFVQKMLPMGCSISCSLWEKFASFIEWFFKFSNPNCHIHHYLDDFIFLGKRMSSECRELMSSFQNLCSSLGVPLADEKTVGPTVIIVFLGLELDAIRFQIRIPSEKLEKLLLSIRGLCTKKKVTLKELQSLVGLLNFCTRAIPVARAFNRRFYDAMSGLSKPSHHVRISSAIKADMSLWLTFLQKFNGICSFPEINWEDSNTLNLYTDSAGVAGLGCAAVLNKKWVFYPWPKQVSEHEAFGDITFLEFVPIVLAFILWAQQLRNKKVVLYIDNKALVNILNKKSSKSKFVMHLLRPFLLECMSCNIQFRAIHIEGKSNILADSLSRCQWQRFRRAAPDAEEIGEQIPETFHALICQLKSIV